MPYASSSYLLQTRIDENAVVVFSKSWCPYCKAAKETLAGFGAKFNAVECVVASVGQSLYMIIYHSNRLDQVEDGSAIQEALKEMTGQSTVPNIFIGQSPPFSFPHLNSVSDIIDS